jgi:predicted Zn-dependent protease
MTAEHDAMERPAEMRARVQHLLEEGRAQEAIQLVEDAMHRHPDKPGLAVLAARTALSTGARAKAEQDLTFIISWRRRNAFIRNCCWRTVARMKPGKPAAKH